MNNAIKKLGRRLLGVVRGVRSDNIDQNNKEAKEKYDSENRVGDKGNKSKVSKRNAGRPLPQPPTNQRQSDNIYQNNEEARAKYDSENRVGDKGNKSKVSKRNAGRPLPQPPSQQQKGRVQEVLDSALAEVRAKKQQLISEKQTADVKITGDKEKIDAVAQKRPRRPLPQPKNVMLSKGDSANEDPDFIGLINEYEKILSDKGTGDDRFDSVENVNWGKNFNEEFNREFNQRHGQQDALPKKQEGAKINKLDNQGLQDGKQDKIAEKGRHKLWQDRVSVDIAAKVEKQR